MDIFKEVCRKFAFSELELDQYINTAPFRYKNFFIAKRNGGRREISQPSRDLKIVQRFILKNFLDKNFIYHDSAKAYRLGHSIISNAQPHSKNSYLLKMDFEDFFPSIRIDQFTSYMIDQNFCRSEQDVIRLGKIFFKQTDKGLVLSIGSPGSPAISNAMLYNFDKAIFEETSKIGITYTRYSDDMAFSTVSKNLLSSVPEKVNEIINLIDYPKLRINHQKTSYSSKKFNRHITGITLTNDGALSIGSKMKRKLRSRIFSAFELNKLELDRLRGYISFVNQVEPDMLGKLRIKYPKQMSLINRE